jgi:hypothetical protein
VYKKEGQGDQILPVSVERIDPELITPAPCGGGVQIWQIVFSGVSGKLDASPYPTGFFINQPEETDKPIQLYRVEIDPQNGAAVNIYVQAPNGVGSGYQLSYAYGMNSLVNLRDQKGMAVPAFGPIELPAQGKRPQNEPGK